MLPRNGTERGHRGLLIVNADDWGRDRVTTDRALDCFKAGNISSVSAMVFMEDSERAAATAKDLDIDAGLHLNMTTPFSSPRCPTALAERQWKLGRFLRRYRFSQVLFHPVLANCFEYVVLAQYEEFARLYEAQPERIDGHHHMHLCSNVVLGGLLPPGTIVRRNFSFQRGEKSWCNRSYRRAVDGWLARRHRLVDYFFSLPPLHPPGHIRKISSLAREFTVEVDAHPINEDEHRFLTSGEIVRWVGDLRIAPRFAMPRRAVQLKIGCMLYSISRLFDLLTTVTFV